MKSFSHKWFVFRKLKLPFCWDLTQVKYPTQVRCLTSYSALLSPQPLTASWTPDSSGAPAEFLNYVSFRASVTLFLVGREIAQKIWAEFAYGTFWKYFVSIPFSSKIRFFDRKNCCHQQKFKGLWYNILYCKQQWLVKQNSDQTETFIFAG